MAMADTRRNIDPQLLQSDLVSPDQIYIAGYDAQFCPDLEKKYECPICLRAMRDAMQTSCGHRFCEACIMAVVKRRDFAKCPVDNIWFRCHNELFPDNAVRREILSLTVKCSMEGCFWFGELRYIEGHRNTCGYQWVSCQYGCTERVKRRDIGSHMVTCELRPVYCQHCNMSVSNNDLTKHQVLECDKFPVQCTLCGECGIQREAIQQHLDKVTGSCSHVVVPCQYRKFGCLYEDKRQNIPGHLSEYASSHLDLVVGKVEALEEHIKNVKLHCADFVSQGRDMYRECVSNLEALTHAQSINYTGQLTWKVPVSNQQHKYSSNSFYTGIPGYKLHAVLELSGHAECSDNYASLFVVFEKGKFDDDIFFPVNARCKATVLGQKSTYDNYSETIVCANVPRCRVDGEVSNQRGRLKFMPTQLLLSPTHCSDEGIFIQISIGQINEV